MFTTPPTSRRQREEHLFCISATPAEIIVLQAALRHYLDDIRYQVEPYKQAAPLAARFIQRLHDQLPGGKTRVEGV